MGDPFIGEIRIFPYTFTPAGWARCDGQTMSVQQNQALASILGAYFGGDGRITFGIPDLKGRSPLHQGIGPGLTPRRFAVPYGDAAITLSYAQMPNHDHTAQASVQTDDLESVPTDSAYPALMVQQKDPRAAILGYRTVDGNGTVMSGELLAPAGQGLSHENRQPCLGVNFCIALDGIYPVRS